MRTTLTQARAIRLAGYVIVLAGAATLLYAIALIAMRFGLWPEAAGWAPPTLPEIPAAWLAALEGRPRLHEPAAWIVANVPVAIFVAAAALLLARIGVLVAGSQSDVVNAVKERRADRLRRARYYREEAERIEPTFAPADKDKKAA